LYFFALLATTGCPTRYRTRHFFNNSNTNEDIATKQTHTIDTFLFISHTTNVLLFKFRYNIFIGVRIIKEMPGLVASGTPCSFGHYGRYQTNVVQKFLIKKICVLKQRDVLYQNDEHLASQE